MINGESLGLRRARAPEAIRRRAFLVFTVILLRGETRLRFIADTIVLNVDEVRKKRIKLREISEFYGFLWARDAKKSRGGGGSGRCAKEGKRSAAHASEASFFYGREFHGTIYIPASRIYMGLRRCWRTSAG